VSTFDAIIDRHDETLHCRKFRRNGTTQVRCERGNAAFARQIIAGKRGLAKGGSGLHEPLANGTGRRACAENHGAPRDGFHQEPFPFLRETRLFG
jgi:hypothetical protein